MDGRAGEEAGEDHPTGAEHATSQSTRGAASPSATPALVPTQSAQVTAPTVQGLNTQLFDFARTGNEAGAPFPRPVRLRFLTCLLHAGVAQILSMLAEANAVKKAVQMGQDQNMTALHLAAQGGHAGVARLLMQNGEWARFG